MSENKIFITCSRGIVPFLAEEVRLSGFPVICETAAGVETEGTLEDTITLNLFLRTGNRVLYLLSEFTAENPDELYRSLLNVEWEKYIHENGYISVNSSVDTPGIKDSRYANLKCKDAVVDRIKNKSGRRPDSGTEKDRAVIYLYWKGSRCSVYIDTSGENLSKRGYRKIPLGAPLQETLASAIIMATGWDGNSNFINPMCGSGTLAIEAALIALDRAPGLLRNNYGFMHLKGFNQSSWQKLRTDAKASSNKSLKNRIIATDISPFAIDAAKKNALTAGVEHLIEFGIYNYPDTPVPEGGGVVILNPEYGERMGKIEELEKTYKGIGDFFKQRCKGYTGYIFTGNPDLAKKVGLRPKRRIQLFNSNIECRLLEYELYEGSRKAAKKPPGNTEE